MSEDLVKFVLPAEFVLSRAAPTPHDLVYGYQRGWLDDEGAVRVAEAALSMGMNLPDAVEELALLLRDDRYRVAELIRAAAEELSASSAALPSENPPRLWLYLALDWVYEHRADFVEPLEVIEMLYADFDYPAEIEGLVRFMPPPPGEPASGSGIEQRWRSYLSRMAEAYSARRSS
ncbi:hypothetical protein BJ980_001667 [Nocardioides daedukensis]|uniref:DUF2247 family protein n=1 Tax=Nocardioides daedukensis TaxID=634462 RepID=A0A7Y9S0J5_9ACTN|nr:DUF2247 family protein [Nocardioides daedukensis]NYG58744.1 hypothetical protein [Nocardioides daedukensis]